MHKCSVLLLLLACAPAFGATREVGAGKRYTSPCQAAASAKSGDIVLIQPGDYAGDACEWTQDRLVIRGAGPRPHIDGAGHEVAKGLWVIRGNDVVVENVEFSGARSQSKNGSGIRAEGRNLTVRNCYFHHNEDGILTGSDPLSEIVVEYSEFGYNGAGDGYSHNLYVGHVGRFTMRFCYSHHALEGHLVKSRATENRILYNRLTGEDGGRSSYELDLPNGGTSYVIGNLMEQGQSSPNGAMIAYQLEGRDPANPDDHLYLVNNTIVNQRRPGTFLLVGQGVTSPPAVWNNIFQGGGALPSNATMRGNLIGVDPLFCDASLYDYRVKPASPAVDIGVPPGTVNGFSLAPTAQYVHPMCAAERVSDGKLDAGAYEMDPRRPRAFKAPCRRTP